MDFDALLHGIDQGLEEAAALSLCPAGSCSPDLSPAPGIPTHFTTTSALNIGQLHRLGPDLPWRPATPDTVTALPVQFCEATGDAPSTLPVYDGGTPA